MSDDTLHQKGKTLEDIFFAERDRELIEKLKQKAARERASVDLSALTGIQSETVLKRVVDLGVTPETLAAFSLVPLLYVAWADRILDQAEREAILTEAHAAGIEDGSTGHDLLSAWLTREPNDTLWDAWKAYHTALSVHLSADEKAAIKDALVEKCRHIARASGGLLGFGSVSADEREALRKLEKLLG